MPGKLPELKVTYHYKEPKTPQEVEEAQKRLDGVFDILFKEVERRRTDPVSEDTDKVK